MAAEQMKVLQIDAHGGPEVMHLAEVSVPEPGADEVQVKMEACGLNFSDIMAREGRYLRKISLPHILGHEICGVIEKIGQGVEGWSVGQRVLATTQSGGGLAEYVVVSETNLMLCPDELTPPQGAALLVQGLTSVMMIDNAASVVAGETVVVHAAAGGVGTLVVQIARAKGARVIGTASSNLKCRLIEELGAVAINYSETDWVKEVLALTEGKGAEVIFESVGGEVLARSYREALADFGRLVVYGVASGDVVNFDNYEVLASNKSLIGFWLGPHLVGHPDRVIAAKQRLVDMVQREEIRLIVEKTFPHERAVDAFEHLQGRKSMGKVVVTA
ncbi:MAG: zinc-binding dehydrogenase [Nitrospinaceae bacterium]|jgi:NADPH:quinone reductase|nr:zinc-binding dehydrogenase [Nitrospinaceae bacterium]MBT3434311.1 zinc-binding dehydrogenase [Nitrospinaceae bacterium]MBT3822474.1 zinc-binding dehydrogenase [Nitrospinaceae bacterium]MBT4092744.1 zinc-binding dehydrogenase [Nitrospinaceae bacterium]MBT4429127.1 zinc-binding dehydrogenase [Nitrospinaceae bacterium]